MPRSGPGIVDLTEIAIANQLARNVNECVDHLTERQQVVARWSGFRQIPAKKVAEILRISERASANT